MSLTELEKAVRLIRSMPSAEKDVKPAKSTSSTKISIKVDEDKATFLQRVQSHLQQIPPHLQLDEFNAIQKDSPFLLMDADGNVNNIIYGYYDLVAFMNRTFNSDPVKDPFVAHTPMNQNSIMMNSLMLQLYRNNPLTQAAYVEEFLSRARKELGSLPKDGMVSKSDYAILKRVADDAAQKIDSYFNPPDETHQEHVDQKEFDKLFKDFSKALLTYQGRDELLKKHRVKMPTTHGKYINATNPYKVPRQKPGVKLQVANPTFALLNK